MTSTIVEKWFGDNFSKLHPALQELHLEGGTLEGNINLSFGNGLAGLIGKRLAKKMNLPKAGKHQLTVSINHSNDALLWSRQFNQQSIVTSKFYPVGTKSNGYWIEKTGPITLKLTVDIQKQGWHWRCLGVKLFGIPIPKWFIPKTTAYKVIENQQYRFFVGFSFLILGELVTYQGLLSPSKVQHNTLQFA